MCDQEQSESSLGEVETNLLDVSRILEECADSDISELSQRVITDLDAEIHRLLRADSTSLEEETESRLSQASVSSIVFEQDEEATSTLRRMQSSSPEHPQSSALYILYGPETESNSSQSPASAESEDEMPADQLMVAIHSGPLGAGTDSIAINTGTNIEVQFQGPDEDCQYEFEYGGSTECFPRPLADELEEVANKGTAPMSNQELDLNALATSASSTSYENSSSEIDGEEEQLLTTKDIHTHSTPKQQTAYTPHDSISEISPGQLTLDMLATTDTEELSNVTSENDEEILPMTAVEVHTTQEATERMVPMNQLSFEMLATTDSELDSDLSQSEEELPFEKSLCHDPSVSRGGTQNEGYRDKSHSRTLVHTSELTEMGAVHSDAPMGINLEMLAMPDSDSDTVSESDDQDMHTAPSNMSELCTEVVTVNQKMNLKANAEHYNVGLIASNNEGEMAQDRHMQPLEEISESKRGEYTQLPPSQPEDIENEDLTSFSSKSKTIASGSMRHAKEDVDGVDLECQLSDTDMVYGSNPVVVPHPSSCSHSPPSEVQPASALSKSNAQVDEEFQQGHIPELLKKIAVLEKQLNKLERAFQEERASLWNIIEGQTLLVQSLHTARHTDHKRIRHYHRSIHQKLEVVEGGVVKVGRECAELQSQLTTLETMRSSVERRRAAVEEGSETHSYRGRSISLLSEQKVTKLKKFFGDNPPVLGLFLKRLGYEQYYPRFLNERIGLLELPHITEEQLIALGIPMGPRLRIMHEAQLL